MNGVDPRELPASYWYNIVKPYEPAKTKTMELRLVIRSINTCERAKLSDRSVASGLLPRRHMTENGGLQKRTAGYTEIHHLVIPRPLPYRYVFTFK
jgi:hypothetical protein